MKGSALSPRAEELLAERALRPLDERELHELEQLGVANDDSFDAAAAALVIATTPIEPMPEHLVDKILAAAPQPDFRRTLPGVVMPADLPRDTMVGVDIASLVPADEVESLPPVTHTLPPSQPLARVAPLPNESMQQPSQKAQTLPPSPALKSPAKLAPAKTLAPPEASRAPAADAPRSQQSQTLPPRVRPPSADVPPSQSQTLPPPDVARPPAIAPSPPGQPAIASTTSSPGQPMPYASSPQSPTYAPPTYPPPTAQSPFASPPPMPYAPLPQESLPLRGEVPPMAAPIVDLQTYRMPQAKRGEARKRAIAPWLAAAACLLVAGGAVWWALARDRREQTVAVQSPASDRAALLANAKDIAKITWTPTQDPTARGATTGDVVWSPSQQRGFMRFVGLTPNDPAQYQYQLWIFDKTRDQAFPVDGGVFDVSSTGEVIVAISPKLHVNDATLFAVTVEKPGGVVVSKRERIVVTAQRG